MIPGKKYTPEEIVAMVWRRKWVILLPFLTVASATVFWSRTLPDSYRSETMIMVVPQRVPETYVKPATSERIEDRLGSIREQILSRTRLENIINDLDLYPDLRRHYLMEDLIEQMRNDIAITVARDDSFRVSYVSSNPISAMKVTEQLATAFINQNLKDREVLAQGTNAFLSTQLEDAKRRLLEHEKKLEDYRRAHAGELPSQLETNLAAINAAQLQIQQLVESINRDKDRATLLERSIADMTSPDSNPEVSTAIIGSDNNLPSGTAQQQLASAQLALRNMELRLKPEHPDILRMKRLIRDLQKKAEAEAMETPLSPGAPNVRPTSPAEIVRQNKLKELRNDLESVRKQVTDKETEEQRLRDQMRAYQQRADAAPTRESELVELSRDYDTLQKLYASLLAKSEDSRMSATLESKQIGEQFRVLDPARVPQRPFSPNRTRLNAMGALLGFAIGLGLAIVLEYRDTSLKTDDDVLTALTIPVLAMVPVMMTKADIRRRQRLRVAGSLAATLIVVAVVAAATWYLVWKA
jgi:polysaccharide chain length determinant protein (PEP-CTERM system associated)